MPNLHIIKYISVAELTTKQFLDRARKINYILYKKFT